jgi:hypothetical protein
MLGSFLCGFQFDKAGIQFLDGPGRGKVALRLRIGDTCSTSLDCSQKQAHDQTPNTDPNGLWLLRALSDPGLKVKSHAKLHRGGGTIMLLENPGKVLEKLATSDRITIVVER